MDCSDITWKEYIRNTILMQEDNFKQQVKELHRLYYTQNELTAKKAKRKKGNKDSEVRSESISGVLGVKTPRDSAIYRSKDLKNWPFDDRCEVELSLSIRGKVNEQGPDFDSHRPEGEMGWCSGRLGLGVVSSVFLEIGREAQKLGERLPTPATPTEYLKFVDHLYDFL